MSFLAEPSDANYRGNVHGGKVMKWIDEVGYALSVQYAGKYCVTKFVDDIEFLEAYPYWRFGATRCRNN